MAAESGTTGLLLKGVNALLKDDSFTLCSQPATEAHKMAMELSQWIPGHQKESSFFEKKMVTSLCSCLSTRAMSQKVRRERMWRSYHTLRTSDTYCADWQAFLQQSIAADMSPVFCQYIGHYMFKELVKLHHPLSSPHPESTVKPLTYEEMNALRYAAGYVPRVLKKKLLKSRHPLKEDIQLCLWDLFDDGDEESDESQDWLELIDRGGLTRVNNTTFEMFMAMEAEVRKHLCQNQSPNLQGISTAIVESEDILFFWSVLSADWEEESAFALLQMIINQWVKIRGFSYASAWVEKYKVTQKKTTQKSKGVRKQLIPKLQKTASFEPHNSDSD